MTLQNDRQLVNTKHKLAQLEQLIEAARREQGAGQAAEIRSLIQLADQLRAEVEQYEVMTQVHR